MTKLRVAVLAIGLLLATSAFADTYQYTVHFNGIGSQPAGDITFTSTSLQPDLHGLGNLSSSSPGSGWSIAAFDTFPSDCCTPNAISVIWVLTANNSVFNNQILYNNAYGDWALGTQSISGNSNFGNDSGTIDVEDITTPEPGSLALLGSGFIGLAGAVRRKLVR